METVTLPRFLDPRLLASHFHIEPGSTVVDVGAGYGAFVPHLATKVGPTGKVVACEVQRPLIDALGRRVQRESLSNVEVRWCDIAEPHSTKLPAESVDFVLLINTLYQVPKPDEALAEVLRIMVPGGVVYVVDWTDSHGGVGPTPEFVIPEDRVIALFESSYFIFERSYPAGAYHYGVSFRKL